jgi:hypothetical protein
MPAWTADSLWLKSKVFMDKANEAGQGSADFPFWCSLSLELLSRAALSNIHPVLNADPREHENLLYAFGFELKAQPQSVPAHSVYIRLEKTIKGFGKTQRELCDYLAILRNQHIHSGDLPFENLSTVKWLPRFYEVVKILCASMGKDLRDIVGDEVANPAEKLIATLAKSIESSVRSKIASHAKVFESNSPEDQEQLRTEASAESLGPWEVHSRCPSCGSEARMRGELVHEKGPVYEDERLWMEQEFMATELECRACALRLLSLEEILAAGLEPSFTQKKPTSLHELSQADFLTEYDNM